VNDNDKVLYEDGQAAFKSNFGELEPLTPKLIAELLLNGHKAKDIADRLRDGLMYCRKRDSFVHPHYLILDDNRDPTIGHILVYAVERNE
jgi:hypothetical protein